MALQEKAVIESKNVTYVYNPQFFKKGVTEQELERYCDVSQYESSGKVVQVFIGRGRTYLVNDQEGRRIIIRHYYRGGMMAKLLKDKFLCFSATADRSVQEYDLLLRMRAMGLHVPTPVLARVTRSGLFVKNDIITKEITGARNIGKILSERRLADEEILKIGDSIGTLFRAGIYHSDLNINNLLLDGADNPWICDFDKCEMTSITPRRYNEMVARLKRSFDKESEERSGMMWTERDFEKLVRAIEIVFKEKY
ncbi:3-deoxy-D-manno-octulosonic acid kinase [Succinimonas sp.]|uniref:3-deoxy-D-manno-octulosonic acid kinase n=1 Tax=Succinimonas sp. TaxID=1936151 RepID=UPI003864E1D8